MSRRLGWSATEEIGLGIPNPRAVVKVPVPPEVAERWAREAEEKELPLDEYLDLIFAEAETD